jgi:hypothetical protein
MTLLQAIILVGNAVLAISMLFMLRVQRKQREAIKDVSNAVLRGHRAVEDVIKAESELNKRFERLIGLYQKQVIDGKVAQKMAERAYSLAGSGVLGVGQIQKALSTRPPRHSYEQALKNRSVLEDLAKREDESIDWLEPTLTEEEREILEDARRRFNGRAQ